MAFESLTERLQGVFKNLRRKGKLSEKVWLLNNRKLYNPIVKNENHQ